MMIVTNPTPLKGIILAGCARANADAGVTVAAQKCGYGSNIDRFIQALQLACEMLDLESQEFSKLMTEQCQIREVQPVVTVGRG